MEPLCYHGLNLYRFVAWGTKRFCLKSQQPLGVFDKKSMRVPGEYFGLAFDKSLLTTPGQANIIIVTQHTMQNWKVHF